MQISTFFIAETTPSHLHLTDIYCQTWNTLALWPESNFIAAFCRAQSQTTISKSSEPLASNDPKMIKLIIIAKQE